MASKDTFQARGRTRLLVATASLAVAFLLIGTMGVVAPLGQQAAQDELRAAIISDYYRLEHAVQAYVSDVGDFPAAAFDLSGGYDGGLVQQTSAPMRHQESWKGPYLRSPPVRPLPQCFWSLAEPQRLLDEDGDGLSDELWVRLHRGYGELDDETAAWLDSVLDDARSGGGRVRVTATWVWFKVGER